ncbi:MAG: hypothetical protein R3F59_14850 [Myxococcota bacterium]
MPRMWYRAKMSEQYEFRRDDLAIEVDGPLAHPDVVLAVPVLEFASSVLNLIENVSERYGLKLQLRGISIVDKCTAIVVHPADTDYVRDVLEEVTAMVRFGDLHGNFKTHISRVRKAYNALPQGYSAKVRIGNWTSPIEVLSQSPSYLPYSIEVCRVVPVRVGGRRPMVRLQQALPFRMEFTLRTTQAMAMAIAKHLYEEIEVDMEVIREFDGSMDKVGKLLAFRTLDGGDPLALWREWFADHATAWSEIDDIEKALERD